MADPANLIRGNCYFQIGYVDADLFIPLIDTYIFVEEIDEEDKYWLFQDASSFACQSEDSGYLAIPEDQLYSMLDIVQLRTKLKGLAHLHPIIGNAPTRKVILTDENRSIILKKVEGVLRRSDPSESLTITTNYRDKGISLEYCDGSIGLTMFLDCKEDPEEEKCVRKIFSDLGILPTTDYLSQHERVRVLSYIVCETSEIVAKVVGDVFVKAYKIKENEKVNPHYRLGA
jgi:hypothetical protein